MIPTVKESVETIKMWGKVIEKCYFKCGNSTRFWHWRTNQPICKSCAKTRKIHEIEKCHPKYKVPTKQEYTKSI